MDAESQLDQVVDLVRRWMHARRITTNTALASIAGLNISTVGDLLSAQRTPSFETLVKIEDGLKIEPKGSLSGLIYGKGKSDAPVTVVDSKDQSVTVGPTRHASPNSKDAASRGFTVEEREAAYLFIDAMMLALEDFRNALKPREPQASIDGSA